MLGLVVLGSAALVGCGLLASPGDYTSGGTTDDPDAGDASIETTPLADGQTPPPDAVVLPDGFVVPSSIGTIALMAGSRDPTSADDVPAWSADAWSGVLAADGSIAAWRIELAAPISGPFDSAGLVTGTWVLVNNGFGIDSTRGTAVQTTKWGPGIVGDWKAAAANGAPGGLVEFTRAFYGAHCFYIGGTRTNPGVDGGPATTFFTKEAHLSTVVPATPDLGASADTGIQLNDARSRPGVIIRDGAAYVVGGRAPVGPAGVSGSVEMANVDLATGTLQAFAEQPALMNAGSAYQVISPSLAIANGYLFVAGGRSNNVGAPTDVALSARIKADGTLDAFQNVTTLPTPLHDFAFVAVKGRLYIAGGVTTTTRTDAVYSATIKADGTLSAWRAETKLPSPRSDFVALTY
jgi:hypothetical protein